MFVFKGRHYIIMLHSHSFRLFFLTSPATYPKTGLWSHQAICSADNILIILDRRLWVLSEPSMFYESYIFSRCRNKKLLVSPQQQGTVCADSAVAMESEYRRESLEIWHVNTFTLIISIWSRFRHIAMLIPLYLSTAFEGS